MLKNIVVRNFKCFKNETIFDFKKTNYKLLEQNTHGKLLKGALFVGENASGKTTAIQPIKLLLDMLFKDEDINLALYQCMFSSDKTTTLNYEFDIEEHVIEYAFSFSGNHLIEETLKVDKKQIIERIKDNAKLYLSNNVSFHEVDSRLLFLKRVYFNTKFEGNDILLKWFYFLKQSVYINAYSRKVITYNGESFAAHKYFEKYGTEKINQFFRKNNFKYTIQYAQKMEHKGIKYHTLEEDKMIFFERKDIDVSIPIFLESVGNQTLINVLPAILHVVQTGGLLIIDEFSSGFHNKLEELLVRYIMNNSKNTQLFFVSHSTNLLTNSLLRPDQIYAVEMKDKEGSILNRFSDEQPRMAQNLEKMYLSGVFGGIPEYGISKE
ncbi:MAG: ATP-binding protein [Lachnospiraceae bacterium]|nr:ATP-binding protein [Lachnospiraceae bacterium]